MAGAISIEKSAEVMEKTFTILKQELNAEEYLIYLQVIRELADNNLPTTSFTH